MRLLRIRHQTIINLDLVTDCQWVNEGGGAGTWLQITFAAPTPASVGACDWTSGARMVRLPENDETHKIWQHLLKLAHDPTFHPRPYEDETAF